MSTKLISIIFVNNCVLCHQINAMATPKGNTVNVDMDISRIIFWTRVQWYHILVGQRKLKVWHVFNYSDTRENIGKKPNKKVNKSKKLAYIYYCRKKEKRESLLCWNLPKKKGEPNSILLYH